MGLPLASLLAAALLASPPTSTAGASCEEYGARELVGKFISAFNRGNLRRLDALFARGEGRRWYSVGTAPGKRIKAAALNSKTLIKYFRARH